MVSRGLDNALTWQYVKSIRAEYYERNSVKICSGFVPDEDIKQHFESLSMLLGVNNVTSTIVNVTEIDISNGAEMFVYLNSCPSYWVYFYHELFNSTNAVSEMIQLTLETSKRKTVRKGEYIAGQLLSKLSAELGFEFLVPIAFETGEKREQQLKRSIRTVKGD